ncbi:MULTISPECIES: FMN-binding protein [Streptomyces]|uniref:FMN-binding domain-containing protein n=1 Tax=Streptomyces scabiei (strain 87.22) TaxID=680198 RepID=C9Z4K8_STRSW|nr:MULTISPECIES: FMN-binding protein [Streptomyces]MBP5864794.1 FMN-binding protein [Streptomyces sp. LBUM 1484]MBP5866286.1 FMN-binding protein [Streptomyces sp. LBUM 1485]MBP5905003.1 FMN-binding protein [Streptomyces sp. LBUM 1478]MBP5932738.1 FMN-binding protein [Streptomyces sp. LBUM 1479]KFG07750.1 FMN-binding protein [Streptomyces scabiei]
MKKSHPIRRTLLATAATVSGIVLLLSLKPASDAGSVQAGAAGGVPSAQGGVAAGAQTLTGSAVDTEYGPVQVRITVDGGKITKAEAVQQPSGGRSTQISGDAIPKLNQAAMTASSADIDAVSGATYTSAGYKESLQSALDQAGKAQDSGAQVLTGTTVQTDYGPVQVRVTVSGGKITKAEAVQAPSGGRSTQITGDSVPKLNQAAVAAGSADIDAVSGATYTSAGYKESLQSALDQAGKAQDSGGGEVEAGGKAQDGGGDADKSGAGQVTGTQVLTGSAVKTDYGPVQVRVTVTDGRITNAEALQQPTGGRSTQISGTAIPQLNKNAVSAGSADIDAVSGATYTSGGYKESLQSALDQAG